MSQPEMTVPDLPPRRTLPPDVRERMRRRVVGGGAVRAPLAAAAAVAVLAAGGAIVAQSTQGDDTIAVAPPSTTSSPTGLPALPTVGQVVVIAPNGSEGDAALCGLTMADVRRIIRLPGRRILSATGDRLCEITHTSVAHNQPRTVPLTGGGSLLWNSRSGVLIGRAPAGTSRVEAAMRLVGGEVVPFQVKLVDDLFLISRGAARMTLSFDTPSGLITQDIDFESLPGQETWTRWREELPPGDPLVARCLDNTMQDGAEWVGDPLQWRPAAFSGPAVDAVLVMRNEAGNTAYCQIYHGDAGGARVGDPAPQTGALVELRFAIGGATTDTDVWALLAGTVDASKVGGLRITDAQGRTVSPALVDGTFAARLDGQPPLEARSTTKGFQIRVLDHQNEVIETVMLE